jgi:RNA polymerase sigma-70 factor (ECF subfamily)
MSDGNRFAEFICRIRAGDTEAAEQLVREYEPLIRREIRLRLSDRRLQRLFDSMDVCQSVMASFFVRANAGSYELNEPRDVVRLLIKMAQNKLASAARAQGRQRRDHRRAVADGGAQLEGFAAREATPSQQIAGKELLERFRQRLTPEELQLAEFRAQGLAWADIAQRIGGTAQSRRMQLARAVERAIKQLGLSDSGDA